MIRFKFLNGLRGDRSPSYEASGQGSAFYDFRGSDDGDLWFAGFSDHVARTGDRPPIERLSSIRKAYLSALADRSVGAKFAER